ESPKTLHTSPSAQSCEPPSTEKQTPPSATGVFAHTPESPRTLHVSPDAHLREPETSEKHVWPSRAPEATSFESLDDELPSPPPHATTCKLKMPAAMKAATNCLLA